MSHGMTYKAWVALRRRYSNGGAEICERWAHFESFFADMGTRPRGTKLVRIDNGKPFGPDNCAWKTTKRLRDGNGLDTPAEHVRWIKSFMRRATRSMRLRFCCVRLARRFAMR